MCYFVLYVTGPIVETPVYLIGPISPRGRIVTYPKSLGVLYAPGPGVLNLLVHRDARTDPLNLDVLIELN